MWSDRRAGAWTTPTRHRTGIDIVSDAICPWCYIGKRKLEQALPVLDAEGLRFTVRWNPFQLNPDMPKEGRDRTAYRIAKFGADEPPRSTQRSSRRRMPSGSAFIRN